MSTSCQHSLVFGLVKKKSIFKNPSANEGVTRSTGLCMQSPFFKGTFFVYTAISNSKKLQFSRYFHKRSAGLVGYFPFPSPFFPASFSLHVFITILSATIFANLKYQATLCTAFLPLYARKFPL